MYLSDVLLCSVSSSLILSSGPLCVLCRPLFGLDDISVSLPLPPSHSIDGDTSPLALVSKYSFRFCCISFTLFSIYSSSVSKNRFFPLVYSQSNGRMITYRCRFYTTLQYCMHMLVHKRNLFLNSCHVGLSRACSLCPLDYCSPRCP